MAATSLKDNLSSAYFGAAHKLYSKRSRKRIIAYVESYEDIAFWRNLLDEYETKEYYFQVMLPSAASLTKGKKMVLINTLNTEELGKNLIACVDSDYDYLLQGATRTSRHVNRNRFVFQTYTYAIENYYCYAGSLHQVCVQATLNDRQLIDFEAFMTDYSRIIHPLFLWSVFFYRRRDTHTFPIYDFSAVTSLQEVKLSKIDQALAGVQRRVDSALRELESAFPPYTTKVRELAGELERLGVFPETTYLFVQGHHLVKDVVMKLLNPVCSVLRKEREQEIRTLAGHAVQFRNELSGYQNSQMNVEYLLKRNTGYKKLYLYSRLKEDLQQFIALLNNDKE